MSTYHDLRVVRGPANSFQVRDYASDADWSGKLVKNFYPPFAWIRATIWCARNG